MIVHLPIQLCDIFCICVEIISLKIGKGALVHLFCPLHTNTYKHRNSSSLALLYNLHFLIITVVNIPLGDINNNNNNNNNIIIIIILLY